MITMLLSLSLFTIYSVNELYTDQESSEFDLEFFTDSDNVTGYPVPIVPNIVHFIRIDQTYINFHDMICIFAAYKNQKPDKIMLHCNNCSFYGKYWDRIKEIDSLELANITVPTKIFGRPMVDHRHQSDILRIKTLMKHGGIYIDNDVYVVKSLNMFRHFEMTISWFTKKHSTLDSMVQIGHSNARFLKLYFETYRSYHADNFYFNAGKLPTKAILRFHPELIRRVNETEFRTDFGYLNCLYETLCQDWEQYYVIHTLIRWTWHFSSTGEVNETYIRNFNATFGEMSRKVFFGSKDLLTAAGTDVVAV